MVETEDEFVIEISDGKAVELCSVKYGCDGDGVDAEFSTERFGTFSVIERDMFEALSQFRKHIEPSGFRPLCNGSRRNCFPSGMSRSMGAAMKLYEIPLDGPATTVLKTFDPASFEQTASVKEQQSYYDDWTAKLRAKV